MLPAYKTEAIETVYTFSEWEKIYNKRKAQRKVEKIYYIRQKLSGLTMATIGIFTPFLLDGDATVSLIALPLGLFLIFTKEKVMMF